MDRKKSEPAYRRGNKTSLRLSTKRRKRRGFPEKKFEVNTCSVNSSVNTNNDCSTSKDIPTVSKLLKSSPTVGRPLVNGKDNFLNNSIGSDSISTNGNLYTCTDSRKSINTELITDVSVTTQVLEGRRIVDIQHLIDALKAAGDHAKHMGCSLTNMHIIGEKRTGFASTINLKCDMCNITQEIETAYDKADINQSAVMGIMNIGSGYSHLEQFTSALDIPCMSHTTYAKCHNTVCEAWDETALSAMAEAAEEERHLAVAAGEVNNDGIPLITVVCDGTWAKRSYRSNYNALSGVAAIVGYRTRKVLFLGVKNKYCAICQSAERKNETIKQHECFKNWSSSSTSMEAEILAEGFVNSLQMYNLIYEKMVADGDSSCFKKILEKDPYRAYNISVTKIECRNHLLRNYVNKIKDLAKDTQAGPLILRRKMKENQLRMRWAVSKAIQYRKQENCSLEEKICHLKLDILNGPSHIFGEHKSCIKSGYFCQEPFNEKDSDFAALRLTELYERLMVHVRYLANQAKSLIYDVDNNTVEQFNVIIAKFVGGKRINFCKKRSYKGRCSAAVLSYNTKRPMYRAYKHMIGRSPGKFAKRLEIRNKQRTFKMRQSANERNKVRAKRKLKFLPTGKDKDYGTNCNKPDMETTEFQIAKESYLKEVLNISDAEREKIEETTRTQRQSDVWAIERRKRVTASKFYDVCSKLPHTGRKSLVESIIRPKAFYSAATDYGAKYEEEAIRKLSSVIGKTIKDCGLFIDKQLQFLAATPDGLIDEYGIVEVKCPYSAREMSPEEAIDKRKIIFWKKDGTVNRNHKWFYQVQGQLHITQREYCYFAVWTPSGLKFERILKEDEFWKNRMEEKLRNFYMDCMLPELIDSRLDRSMDIREPAYVQQAQKKRQAELDIQKQQNKRKKT